VPIQRAERYNVVEVAGIERATSQSYQALLGAKKPMLPAGMAYL